MVQICLDGAAEHGGPTFFPDLCRRIQLLEEPLVHHDLYGLHVDNICGLKPTVKFTTTARPHDVAMKHVVIAKVTASGQLSLPGPGSTAGAIVDEGDRVVVRPVPDDPIKAACGSLAGRGGRTELIRARARREETAAERRRRRA